MAQPSRTTVTIDGNAFKAITTDFSITTEHDSTGMPAMGSVACAIDVQVDINDTGNMPFATLQSLFQSCKHGEPRQNQGHQDRLMDR